MNGEVAFGAEISQDRSKCAIVAAGRSRAGKKVGVDLVYYDSPAGAAARLDELYAKHDPVAVVVDGRSQSATLLQPLANAGIVVTQPSAQDLAAATGDIADLVNLGRLEHLDQPPLTQAIRGALRRALGGAQAWERRVPADQSPLVAATLAAWAYLKWEAVSEPSVWMIGGAGDTGRQGPGGWQMPSSWTDGIPPWVQRQ